MHLVLLPYFLHTAAQAPGQIFTPDSATVVKFIPPEKACKETNNFNGLVRVHYDFYDAVSNGKKVRRVTLLSLCSCVL